MRFAFCLEPPLVVALPEYPSPIPLARSSIVLICCWTRDMTRCISSVGYGRRSGAQRSEIQDRVSSWWSVDASVSRYGDDDDGSPGTVRVTEARMSEMSMSMLKGGRGAQAIFVGVELRDPAMERVVCRYFSRSCSECASKFLVRSVIIFLADTWTPQSSNCRSSLD